MIQVTEPFIPPFDEYVEYIRGIWDRKWLTNSGPLSKDLEEKLQAYLEVENFTLVSNGTVSLQMAFKALGLEGEVITTPFSYIATTSSLLWQNLTPVFADVDPTNFNIDPITIEPLINSKTTAILATHVFGCPCEVEHLKFIAEKHGLKLIYDSAHAFGVRLRNESLLNWGDVTSISMHATKLFHTVEGGGLTCNSEELSYTFSKMRNFGHDGFDNYTTVGINAKCSEFHSAMGLVNLKYIDKIIAHRKVLYEHYVSKFDGIEGITFQSIDYTNIEYNYGYFPILLESEKTLLKVLGYLQVNQINPRRYFYPSLNTIWEKVSDQKCKVSEDISRRVLCLPLSNHMNITQIDDISSVLLKSLSR